MSASMRLVKARLQGQLVGQLVGHVNGLKTMTSHLKIHIVYFMEWLYSPRVVEAQVLFYKTNKWNVLFK